MSFLKHAWGMAAIFSRTWQRQISKRQTAVLLVVVTMYNSKRISR
jgi:hypothetical protein